MLVQAGRRGTLAFAQQTIWQSARFAPKGFSHFQMVIRFRTMSEDRDEMQPPSDYQEAVPPAPNLGNKMAPSRTGSTFRDLITHQPPYTPIQLREQRRELIRSIQEIRKRPLVVYATNINIGEKRIPAYMHREDIIPLSEMLDGVKGQEVDILLETGGGLAEVAVEIVSLLRPRFDKVGFIVPHIAMSAGTILVMSGDEILMDHRSSLGPIDPQFSDGEGRPVPAQAILAGIETIKEEVAKNNGQLHPVYIPILRNVDPGKLQSAQNASELSRRLVTEWLETYKFRDWPRHRSTGKPVTPEERHARAAEIAAELCKHQKWLSHGRPIKVADLRAMRLDITDYGTLPDLQAAIWSLWTNLSVIFSMTNSYKVYESETFDVLRAAIPQPAMPAAPPTQAPGQALLGVRCQKCGTEHRIQANFGKAQPLQPGAKAFPKDCQFSCSQCGNLLDLRGLKLQIEAQLRRPIVL